MKNILDFFHHLFIPQEQNNYRAKALHLDFLTYYLIFAVFLTFGLKKANLSNVLGFATDITVDKLYQLTNQQRTQNQLPTLTYNAKLSQAAAGKAQDMFNKSYWSHYGPDGATPWDFILGAGYKYEYAGENLAKNFLFSQGVVDAWMNSPTHRDNILRKDYTEVGFAVVNGTLNGEATTLVVQMFGKPLTSTTALENQTQKQTAILPTIAPTLPAAQANKMQPMILSKQSPSKTFSLNKFNLDINLIFLIFLGLALILDFYVSAKLNVFRLSGKNIAHLIFIGFIILGLTLVTRGAIM